MSRSIKCKNCGTVNWATSAECLRCKAAPDEPATATPAGELPPEVHEALAFRPGPRLSLARYLFGGIVTAVLLGITVYVFCGAIGFNKENKTSLLTRLYWRKPPPGAEVIQQGLEARLKCFREFRKVDSTVVKGMPAEHPPCLRGTLPLQYEQRFHELGFKTCKEMEQPIKSESGQSATVNVVKTEVIDAHFEKLPAIDPKGAAEGHPERSATIFFRTSANMDYFITNESWTSSLSSDRERTAAHDTVVLLLYWNEQTRSWQQFEQCEPKQQ
jgi:hypothetical protein